MPRPTSKDVARLAGVSRTTVSLVLNDVPGSRIPEETRRRVLRAVKELDYRPNQIARGLKTSRTHTLALMIPSVTNPFYANISKGVEDVAHAHGYTVFLCNTYRDRDREEKYCRAIIQRQVDGVISSGLTDRALIQEMIGAGVAVVSLDREIDRDGVVRILVDHYYGGWLAAECLLRLGHTRVAFVSGPLHNRARRDRVEGFRGAFTERGLKLDEAYIFADLPEAPLHQDDYEIHNGRRQAKAVLRSPLQVTAIACINDMSAIGVLRGLAEENVKVPEDISLIGYDDIPLASIVQPALTTIGQPQYERGRAAAEALMARLENKTAAIFPEFKPWLVERASTAGPRRI